MAEARQTVRRDTRAKRDCTFEWGARTYVMGILNVTPDSFSGDGVGTDPERALDRALRIQAEGADLLDIGGESTRPGHVRVSVDEELRRVLPALRRIAPHLSIPISIDTTRATVAESAVAAGASIVNDISGLEADPAMAETVSRLGVDVVLMSRSSGPPTDVASRVKRDLDAALARAETAGIPRGRIIVDPGFGFGKNATDNIRLLGRLHELRGYGLPILVGLSRKRTLAALLGSDGQRSEAANAALTALAVRGGADMVRVHDVAAAVDAVRIADAVTRRPLHFSGSAVKT